MSSIASGQSPRGLHEALEILRKRLLVAPHDADLRLELAHELAALNHFQDATIELRKIIALNPNHLEARKFLCEVLTAAPHPGHGQDSHSI
jgi:Flp pilus assembly protein TadD